MLPAAAYTSDEVFAWEQRHFFAGSVGLPRPGRAVCAGGATQRAVTVGDVPVLVARTPVRCGRRLREHLPAPRPRAARRRGDVDAQGRRLPLPRVELSPRRLAHRRTRLRGRRVLRPSRARAGPAAARDLARLGVRQRASRAAPFAEHVGGLTSLVAPYAPERLVRGASHEYVVAANWKVITENYHECYHCPLIHPGAVRRQPAGQRRQLRPARRLGGRVDGPARRRRHDVARRAQRWPEHRRCRPAAGALPRAVPEPAHLAAPRLRHDPPDDAAVAGRDPGRVRVVLPARRRRRRPDPSYAVDFWDRTNRQDWAACESVQRGLASPHFRPGPLAPNEDAVHEFVTMVARGYRDGGLTV